MTAITVRLSTEDHKLLQLACLVSGRSQNALITQLLHAEIDRLLPGKRSIASDPEALWKALGVPAPEPNELDRRWAASVVDELKINNDSQDQRAA